MEPLIRTSEAERHIQDGHVALIGKTRSLSATERETVLGLYDEYGVSVFDQLLADTHDASAAETLLVGVFLQSLDNFGPSGLPEGTLLLELAQESAFDHGCQVEKFRCEAGRSRSRRWRRPHFRARTARARVAIA